MKMRVLLATPYDLAVPGGVNRHVFGLADALGEWGDSVRIVGPSSARAPSDDPRVVRLGSVTRIPMNGAVTRTTFDAWRVLPGLRRVMRDFAPDVVHVHEPVAPLPCAAALWMAPRRAVRTGTFHTYSEAGRGYLMAWPWCRAVWSRLDLRVAVSEAARDYATRYVGGSFVVVPHGVRLPAWRPPRVPSRPVRLIFVGRMDEPRKGFSILLKALRELGDAATLVAVGPASAAQRTLARGLPVEIRGEVGEAALSGALFEADILCLPSLGGESFGLAALEALAHGVPVIASAIRGYSDLLGAAAELVPPGDPGALAAAVRRLAADPAALQGMRMRGRELAERHAWPSVAGRLRELYRVRPERGGLADRLESGAQAAFRSAASLAARARAAGREFSARDFRGGRCHCDPGISPHFLHSEGLREACDFVVDAGSNVGSPHRPRIPVQFLAAAARGLAPGATVHVKADLLGEFAERVLPSIPGPVVLVTGDSDVSPVRVHRGLLDHPKVFHWFAQNCDWAEPHPKLTRIPIGIDNPVYTKLEKRIGFALTMALGRTPPDPTVSRNDMGDQKALNRAREAMPSLDERPLRVLCTFHQNQKLIAPDIRAIGARFEAWSELRGNPNCHFVPARLPQRECWEIHREFAFEASPHGNGLDCFRTWEALVVGTIPIVKASSLDRLYRDEELPVVIVESWREITEENLRSWRADRVGRLGDALLGKLSLDHWTGRIKKMALRAGEGAR